MRGAENSGELNIYDVDGSGMRDSWVDARR